MLHVTQTPEAARRFFKKDDTSWGPHAFLGVTTPALRSIARKYATVDRAVIHHLLCSPYNEEKLLALFILVRMYQKASVDDQKDLCHFYLEHLKYLNSWNLIDSSAYQILGHYVWDKDRSILTTLAGSSLPWERRSAIVATLYFIRKNDIEMTFNLARQLVHDTDDLIHKAVGWMLREAGKKDEQALRNFVHQHQSRMPRIMVRYAQEHISNL